MKHSQLEHIGGVSNDGAASLAHEEPYTVTVTITGAADLLFHRWSVDGIAAKALAKKGSQAKKEDDIESYVWRDDRGHICLPGEYLRAAVVNAARFKQDPRSPRKSAMDLFKAGVVSMTNLASLGSKDWDYLDRRRVTVQRNGITRIRPAFKQGWKATIQLAVLLPEYISETLLRDVVGLGGRLIGVGDFRPTFGRYDVTKWVR
jgi:hypothetical protein